MNGDYHTTDAVPQSRAAGAETGMTLPPAFGALRSTKPLRSRTTLAPAHPLLTGDREMLRKLRAAEMATWESVRPQTTREQSSPEPKRETLWRLCIGRSLWGENLSLLFLAVCGGAAVFVGIGDLAELLTGWIQFIQGISNLLQ